MNKILSALFAILLITSANLKAQNVIWDTLPYSQQSDWKLANLNKNLITTNILYDRVMPISEITRFKAVENFTDTTSPRHWAQAYYELYNSSYNTTGWQTPDLLNQYLDTNNAEVNAIPIGILNYKYNLLDSNAYVDGLVDTSATGQLLDVPNRPRSPYFQYETFIASPVIADNEIFEEGEDYTFYIDPEFFKQNTGITITQIRIDFGDGQGEWVVDNPYGNNNAQSRGFFAKILKKVGKTLVGRIVVIGFDIAGHWIKYGNPFKIKSRVKKPDYVLTPCRGGKGGGVKWVIDPDPVGLSQVNAIYNNHPISYQQKKKINGVRQYIDVKDTAYFFFKGDANNCNNAVVRRPVIFIDGFDPQNSRDVGKIYRDYINVSVERNGGLVNLGDYMLDNEYADFIILDFKHGNDILERNAMALVALINRLNATYGNNYLQDITLIGPSMGSLISQYALTYMEANGINHRVKTYISFDGNHQGANVPIGLQHYIEYITKRGILKNIKTIREGMYNGYGAKQQLAHHHSSNSEFPAPDVMRNQFLNNLTALSPLQYPVNCRKVALINGTNRGILNPSHGTNTNILKIDIKRSGWKSLWGLCNDDICKKIKWTARTATNSGSNRVAEMWTASPLYNTLFWLPLGKKNYYAQAAWGNSSQDNAPGGLFGEFFNDEEETDYTFLAKEMIYLLTGDKPNFDINLNNFTMMPSYSSADLRFPNKNLYMRWDDKYLCGKTPFDYVYAPPSNEEHVYVSAQGSVYFENEVRKTIPELPSFIDPNIAGHYNPCTGSTETYTIQSCKNLALNINWTIEPNDGTIQLNTSATPNSIDATFTNPATGVNYQLKAEVTGVNAQISTRNFSFNPSFLGSVSGLVGWNTYYSTNLVEGDNYLYLYGSPYGANFFEINIGNYLGGSFTNGWWEYISGDHAMGGNYMYLYFDVYSYGPPDSYYNYHFTDECGVAKTLNFHFISTYAYPPAYRMQSIVPDYEINLSPNPANNFIMAKVVDLEKNKSPNKKVFDYETAKSVTVYDKLGVLVIQRREIVPKQGLRIDITKLRRSDVYTLIIEDKNGIRLTSKFITK